MKKRDFINRVLLIMNEANMSSLVDSSYIGADAAQIDKHIEGSYIESWRRCAAVMPRNWLANNKAEIINQVIFSSEGYGHVDLPDDFYMLSKFKMKVWQKAVFEASLDNDKVSSIQSNEYTRGSTIRPVCVIGMGESAGELKQVLYYYSVPKIDTMSQNQSEHVIEMFYYIPSPKPLVNIRDDESLGIDPRILEPLAYLSASSVFTLLEKYDIAKALEQKVLEMFPAFKNVKGTFKQ